MWGVRSGSARCLQIYQRHKCHAGEHSDVGFCRYDRLHPVCTRRPWRHGGKTASDHVVEQSQTRNPHLYHFRSQLDHYWTVWPQQYKSCRKPRPGCVGALFLIDPIPSGAGDAPRVLLPDLPPPPFHSRLPQPPQYLNRG